MAPDEDARFARYAEQIVEIQKKRNAKYGNGRALHRKGLAAFTGTFEILPGIPEHARHGLFATPATHPVRVRLSSGGPERMSDRAPDIRGFAFRVSGLPPAPGALGGTVTTQDFALINHEVFSAKDTAEFMGVVTSVSNGVPALLAYLVKTHGILGGLKRAKELNELLGKKFTGFATETFFSAMSLAVGPFAARVRLLPVAGEEPDPAASKDLGGDISRRVQARALVRDFQLQFYTDDVATPIEDGSKNWDSPYVTVARLTLPKQEPSAVLLDEVDRGIFDPWTGLAAHRPLGDVMRARKHAYFASQKARGAA